MRWPWHRSTPPDSMDLSEVLSDTDRIQSAEDAARLVLPPDATLNSLVRAAAMETEVPIVVVNFVYGDTTDPMASIGLDFAGYSYQATDSICSYVAASGRALIFDSVETAPLLANCLNADGLTFYAGVPIRYRGLVVGALGIADDSSREHPHRRVLQVLRGYARRIEEELRDREDSGTVPQR